MEMIKRDLFLEIQKHLTAKEISLIVGPRQVGKTTLMQELKRAVEARGLRTLWLNLDYEMDRRFFASQDDFLRKVELEFGSQKGLVFVDEIQRKENAGLFLKGLYDRNLSCKLVVSGSGSLELKERIHESLTGRKRLFELNPVSFSEFVDFRTGYKYSGRLAEYYAVHQKEILNLLVEYLNFGGYPRIILEPALSEKIRLMSEIFHSYLEKDIAHFLRVERLDAFTQLVKILANQCGRIVNHSEIARQVGVSVPTIKNYLWYAEKTFVIKMVTPFFRNKGKEILKSPVVYFYDSGLRNFALDQFGNLHQPAQLGFVFQNFVANRLATKIAFSGQSLHFWRTVDRAEVDFVLDRGRDILPIEVKYAALKKPELTRSMRSFLDKYKPAEAMVVNLTLEAELKVSVTKVRILPFHRL